ncbi:hypothetical protein [Halovivax cerinus]|uniref:Restriction endonuclease n=1 Tax=Halovivax cerinus TaxID=1487865 RepID=A0ABD5NJH2_9EURY|nr:hypothetical protein [Halovivax cerinus]
MDESVTSTIRSGLSSLKNPEYTGTNRCPPCTGVNVAIGAVLGLALALVHPALGAVAFGLSLVVIYVRGYLVPGTPTLTKRYLPDTVLARFEHEPPMVTDGGGGNPLDEAIRKIQYREEHSVDGETYLKDAGVVEVSGDGRTLSSDFRAQAEERAASFDGVVDVEFVAEMFDVTPDEVSVPDRDYPAIETRRRIRRWPSEPAFVVDVAAHDVLRDRRDDWSDVPVEQRVRLLRSIRSLWETCPTCGGEVSFDEETVTSCCREFQVVTYRCGSCDAHFVELDPDDVDAGTAKKGFIP